MLATSFLSLLFIATGVLATPLQDKQRRLLNLRRATSKFVHSSPPQEVAAPSLPGAAGAVVNKLTNALSTLAGVQQTRYSFNWAGAVHENYTAGTFKSVTGQFVLPTPRPPRNALKGEEYDSSTWVGIDGSSCPQAILQVGIIAGVTDGKVEYAAWYEWYPANAQLFETDIPMKAGDNIRLTVTADSLTSGTAVVENLSTRKTVKQKLTSDVPLCGSNAEWIVEDFKDESGYVPFSNFDTYSFVNAQALTSSGQWIGANNATVWEMRQNGTVLTQTNLGWTSVNVHYKQ